MKNYDHWRWLWPPRPSQSVPATMLSYYQNKGWYAQFKKNGSLALITIDPDRSVCVWNRHQELMNWSPPDDVKDQLITNFAHRGSWSVYVGELLHQKAREIKNTLYLFDVLVQDGELLEGSTYHSRLQRLAMGAVADSAYSHLIVTQNVWVARSFLGSVFEDLYGQISSEDSIDEGLVLKNPNAKLDPCINKKSNGGWQVKVRYGKKNFAF